MQRKTPTPTKRAKLTTLPPEPAPAARASAPAARTQSHAIEEILVGVPAVARSVRVLIVGASQNGKTYFARRLCAALAARGSCGSLVVCDQKYPDRVQYAGKTVNDLAGLRAAVLDCEPAIVCRAPLAIETAAQAVRDAAECGQSSTLLVDEITPALKVRDDTGEPMERVWSGPSLIWLCLQGGGLGASLVQLCQLPRMVPSSLVDNATAFVFFGTGGRSLDYAIDLKLLPREAAGTVSSLTRGQCVVCFPDRNWDGLIYGPA